MELANLQGSLAASLAGKQNGPEGCDPDSLERARTALEAKRRRAARHLLPRLYAALGSDWDRRFHEHCLAYQSKGMLYHVDDAWELALTILHERDPRFTAAAHDDLLFLRLRWVRDRSADAKRIRERRAPLVAVARSAPRRLVVRLAGPNARTIYLRLGGVVSSLAAR